MSTIFSTRNGFLYQDRFAVLTYLSYFQSKEIKAFYVDFSLANQRSLDIKLLTISNSELIYEVKTGESFKMDKRKKESSEIRDAFISLLGYKKLNPGAKLNLIISPKLQGGITTYWDKFSQINISSSFHSRSAKKASAWLHKRLRIPGIPNSSDFYLLCKDINIEASFSDQIQNDDDRYPDIDDAIIRKIDDLSILFKAGACSYELPSEHLLFQMLHECRRFAGTNTDLSPVFEEMIASFLTQRRLVESYKRPTNISSRRQEKYQQVRSELNSWKNEIVLMPQESIAVSKITEGKQL